MVDIEIKAPKTENIKKYWNDFGSIYSQIMEYSTQPSLYSLIVNLKINEANRIFELSCGGGKSLSLVCSLKKQDCEYFVSDLSENLISLASKRMEIIENDYNGNLQFWDKSFFEESAKLSFITEFPKSRVFFKHLNNENLLGVENNSFDVVFSNLSLQLVENPEKMLSETFRVLKPGGKAGFTVWGRKKNSKMFTTIPMVLKRHGIALPQDERSNFHLGDREELINLMKSAGFNNILCWYQFFAFNLSTEEDFENITKTKSNRRLLELLPEEKIKIIKDDIIEEFKKNIKEHNPIGLDVLFVIGYKGEKNNKEELNLIEQKL